MNAAQVFGMLMERLANEDSEMGVWMEQYVESKGEKESALS